MRCPKKLQGMIFLVLSKIISNLSKGPVLREPYHIIVELFSGDLLCKSNEPIFKQASSDSRSPFAVFSFHFFKIHLILRFPKAKLKGVPNVNFQTHPLRIHSLKIDHGQVTQKNSFRINSFS